MTPQPGGSTRSVYCSTPTIEKVMLAQATACACCTKVCNRVQVEPRVIHSLEVRTQLYWNGGARANQRTGPYLHALQSQKIQEAVGPRWLLSGLELVSCIRYYINLAVPSLTNRLPFASSSLSAAVRPSSGITTIGKAAAASPAPTRRVYHFQTVLSLSFQRPSLSTFSRIPASLFFAGTERWQRQSQRHQRIARRKLSLSLTICASAPLGSPSVLVDSFLQLHPS